MLGQLLAQTSLPPVYEIRSDTAGLQELDSSYWQKLEDKEGKWTISDVIKLPLSGKFHSPGSKAAPGIDTINVHTYWYRYSLRNITPLVAKISLTSIASYFDVFIINNDSLQVQYHNGYLREWDKRDGLKFAGGSGAISLKLNPGEEVLIYDRRNRHWTTNFNSAIRIWNTDSLIREKYVDYVDSRVNYFGKVHLQEAFVLGLLLLAIFLNLFFYRIVREKVYLYFALYALFLGINRLWNISSQYATWEHPGLLEFVPLLGYAWAFIPYYLIQFFRQFLKTKTTYPGWDKLLISLGILNIVFRVFEFSSHVFSFKVNTLFFNIGLILPFFLIPLCIVITLLLFIRRNDRSIRFLIIGSFPLLLLYFLTSPQEVFGIEIKFIEDILRSDFRLIEVICITWLVISFSLILSLRFDQLRKENAQRALDNERLAKEKEIERTELIEKQKAELEIQVAERTADLKRSLEDLKATQSQLVQSEKMASLGELTAGIAHEIQNPLNFVNNFSEVNTELIEEMKVEMDKGNLDDAKALANDIKENEEKISRHGKRADSIVKGMLQHSRSNSGQKESTDINNLVDECLRLSFHGMRAKDKSFNAKTETDFDNSLQKINIVSQDIGRVLLNLFTNSFYSVLQKRKQPANNYEPVVYVKTERTTDAVRIIVRDNGMGIPQKVLDKVFQPFFTTKPTGEGTGLGLSMSYDIITKGHGGELKVETKEGEYAEFIIILPV